VIADHSPDRKRYPKSSCGAMEKKVAVVILNYKTYEDTKECLSSIFNDEYRNKYVVVIDNCSGDNSLEYLQAWLASSGRRVYLCQEGDSFAPYWNAEAGTVLLLQARSNRGYAAGNNIGIRTALEKGVDYVWILNSDTVVTCGALRTLIDFAEGNPDCGVAGPKVVRPSGEIDRTCARRRSGRLEYFLRLGVFVLLFTRNRWVKAHSYIGEYDYDLPKCVDILSGSCMLFKERCLRKIGLFDERTFLYLEEFIIHEKMRHSQYHAFVVPSALVIHKGQCSTSAVPSKVTERALHTSLKLYLREYRQFGTIITWLILANANVAGWLGTAKRQSVNFRLCFKRRR
jgi:GT2 family glycosyltransferase